MSKSYTLQIIADAQNTIQSCKAFKKKLKVKAHK